LQASIFLFLQLDYFLYSSGVKGIPVHLHGLKNFNSFITCNMAFIFYNCYYNL